MACSAVSRKSISADNHGPAPGARPGSGLVPGVVDVVGHGRERGQRGLAGVDEPTAVRELGGLVVVQDPLEPLPAGLLEQGPGVADPLGLRLGWAGSSVEAHSGIMMPLMALPWANSRMGLTSDSSEFRGLLVPGRQLYQL